MRPAAILALAFLSAPHADAAWHSVAQQTLFSFTGPGDIVSGATAWYGLRAYSAAVAGTGTQPAIQARRAANGATQDIVILTSGNLDVASAATFAGTDATCTGTISGTTLTCATSSSTPNANDPVSGAGIVQPSYIVSCGTFTGGAGTCTLNASQTVSVGETITMQVALSVAKWYDQSGALACSAAACDSVQATAANQPILTFNCLGALPCLTYAGAQVTINASGTPVSAQPVTFSAVAIRTGNLTVAQTPVAVSSSSFAMSFVNSAAQIRVNGGVSLPASAADNSWHTVQGVINNTSSAINIDGTDTTGSAGSGSPSGTARVGGQSTVSSPLTGSMTEVGIWPSAFSSGNRTSMCHNQFVYWGTPNSC